MPELDDFIDLLSAAIVIIIISILITLAWMSTYVRDQPIVATAVVVFQQETVHNTSMENIGHTPASSTDQTLDCETPSNISPDSESCQSPSNDKEKIPVVQDAHIDNQIPEETEGTKEISITENSEEVVQSCSNNSTSLDQTEEFINVKHLSTSEELKSEETSLETDIRNRKHDAKSENSDILKKNLTGTIVTSDIGTLNENISHESIRIKLKFLDDTQRLVRGQLTDEVGNFKRANFDPELTSNRVVRLIFNGQLLNRDHFTLSQYGLFDNCVVHCHISQPQIPAVNERGDNAATAESEGLDLSEFLSPLLLVIVAFLWYVRYEYSYIFNTSATIVLVCLTALLLISQYALVISFNISLGFDGNSSSSSSARPTTTTTSSAVDTDPPRIEQNTDVASSSHPLLAEISEADRGSPATDSNHTDNRGTTDITTESIGHNYNITNHRPHSSRRMPSIFST